MKNTIAILGLAIFILGIQGVAYADEGLTLQDACKVECSTAKSEHEAHKCMNTVVKSKKSDKGFKKSECFHAYEEHEKNEKKDGHKH